MRDVGALFLAIGVILLAAAWLLERRVVLVASLGFLVYAVPHAVYHLLNLAGIWHRRRHSQRVRVGG